MTDLATDVLEEIEISLPCEHSQHGARHHPDRPAAWWAWSLCARCGVERAPYPLCDVGYARLAAGEVRCSACGWLAPSGWEMGMRFRPIGGGS